MSKSKILDKADDPRYIPGIYNYCDRWCERCAYTSRCMNFQMMQEDEPESNDENIDKEQFWKNIEDTFRRTKELITRVAMEYGIDLDNLESDGEYQGKSAAKQQKAREHILATNSLKYIQMVQDWLRNSEPLIKEKQEALNANLRMGVAENDTRKMGDAIKDALEVIRWYNFQINVKLMRALSNESDISGFTQDDTEQSDADGSAKVALIGIDRSLLAWSVLYEAFPQLQDSILSFLVLLERLKRRTEQEFPKAREFVRPGFDTDDEPVYKGG